MKGLSTFSEIIGVSEVDILIALGVELKPCAAKTRKQAWAAYRNAIVGSEAEVAAARLCADFCNTVAEAKREYSDCTANSETERVWRARWDRISLEKVAAAPTIYEVMNAYEGAPEGGEAQKEALRKAYRIFRERGEQS